MHVDLSPLINAALAIAATALSVFGSMALNAVIQHYKLKISAAQIAAFDDGLTKALTGAAMQLQADIAAKGWAHPEVISPALKLAASILVTRFPDALAGVGLSSNLDDPRNAEVIRTALIRALPAAFATAAYSPATPPAPPAV